MPTLSFCEFTQVMLTVRASEPPLPERPQLTDAEGNAPSPVLRRLLYRSIMQKLDQDKWSGVPVTMIPRLFKRRRLENGGVDRLELAGQVAGLNF
jgi:hypothetical protein